MDILLFLHFKIDILDKLLEKKFTIFFDTKKLKKSTCLVNLTNLYVLSYLLLILGGDN